MVFLFSSSKPYIRSHLANFPFCSCHYLSFCHKSPLTLVSIHTILHFLLHLSPELSISFDDWPQLFKPVQALFHLLPTSTTDQYHLQTSYSMETPAWPHLSACLLRAQGAQGRPRCNWWNTLYSWEGMVVSPHSLGEKTMDVFHLSLHWGTLQETIEDGHHLEHHLPQVGGMSNCHFFSPVGGSHQHYTTINNQTPTRVPLELETPW